MKDETFYLVCPEFGESFLTKQEIKRDYAHPVDLGIIKFLDNSAVNTVFRQLVEMIADSTYGPLVASGIPISEKTYPEINLLVNECVQELRIKRPYVIISSALQGLNAMTFGNDEEPYIAISPLMIKMLNSQQLKFVIGHECGHIAMGHVIYHSVVSIAATFASAVPVIGPIVNKVGFFPLKAWSRRSEISADRAGLLCCGSCESAQRTLLQLELPYMDASELDIEDYVEHSEQYMKKGIIRKLNEFDDAHPIIPKRIQALNEFAVSEKYHRLTGEPSSEDATPDAELERRIENIIKIL
ncbi:MAG: M48 family metallopeptidase [Lachnospiraceae bacterium]|nr:M48 family metallopeptidase [Lachnospiraceae bacterium]